MLEAILSTLTIMGWLGIILGIVAALNKNKLTDHIISTAVMVFISVPSFVIISLLLLWFCYENKWLPSQWPSSGLSLEKRFLECQVRESYPFTKSV